MHKALNSRNVVLFHSHLGPTSATTANITTQRAASEARLDFASPQILGFGVARRERPGERTIDVRDGEVSPWRFWLHPELQLAGGEHRRFERRYDIYALGLVLFEIGMWQDLHYYSSSCTRAEEVRTRVISVCAREMAHRMGETYKNAVMACLDGDEVWKPALTDADVETGDGDVLTITQLFFDIVFAPLSKCCQIPSS